MALSSIITIIEKREREQRGSEPVFALLFECIVYIAISVCNSTNNE